MNSFKNFMSFSRSERIAIITIVLLIIIILIIKYLIISNPPKRDYFKHDLDSIVARREMVLDSVRIADSINRVTARHNEIPRFARDDKGSSFRAKRSVVEKSYAKQIDKTRQATNHDSVGGGFLGKLEMTAKETIMIIDINSADTTILKQLPAIGSSFAKWIVEYREKLGGYCEREQLLEVYRMDSVRYNGIKDYVMIDSTFTPKRLKINSESFKILLKHPYLEYEDVKKIVNHREQKGLITSWGQLETIVGDAINPKLRYYIDYQ